ncbi:nitroreductase family protein [Deinococcus aquiradiocola]|uniref:nitroreductase family protein n=1 Tax=Deinococcus aquiradiocola TaxID=393059 RepID=UPI0016696DEE|nr:nitroreductase family protein [Deinococcus aquiradiocola]
MLTPDVDGGRAGPLRAGSYRYDPLHHQLIWQCGPVLHALRDQLGSPLSGVFAGAAVSVDWQRTHGQYGHFGYRLGLLEAGMQAAQLGIVAEALGWHVSLVWDFPDAPVNAALGMGNHERVVALVLLRRLPGTVRVPPYLPVPPTRDGGPVSLPGATLETLDRVTHLQLGPGRADGDVGPPERVTPPLLVPRTLRQTLRARHSGLAVFAPVAEQGRPDLLDDLLRPALAPAPVVDGTPDASVSIEALLNGRDGLKHHRLTRDGPPVIGGPRADPLMRTVLEEVQPDMPLAHLPLTAYLCVPLHGPSPRTYRRVHLQAGLIAQRILLLAAQQGWAGRASCSFNAPRVQRLLELDGPVVPLLQLAFGREPTARLAHDHHRLSLHP